MRKQRAIVRTLGLLCVLLYSWHSVAGESLPKKTVVEDRLFDQTTAAEVIDARLY